MTEQRKKQLMIAGALVAVVALVLVFVVFRSRGGEEVATPPAATGGAELPSAAGGTPAGGPTYATAAGAGPAAMPGAGGGASATDIGIMKPPLNARPRVAPRRDPFQAFPLPPDWLRLIERMRRVNEPPPIYQWGLPAVAVKTTYVSGLSTATPGLPYAVATGTRRMAGILWDGRVWAILETDDGQSRVVKPGDVLDDGSRVAAISRDSMVVAQAGQRQTVGMKGKPAPAAPAGGTAATNVSAATTTGQPPTQIGPSVSLGPMWGASREGE